MMNKTLYILLLLMTVASTAYAQGGDTGTTPAEPRVRIFGNVYGGGELAQTRAVDTDLQNQLIVDSDLATLFTKQHTYTTYVILGSNSEVYGNVFGGGKGQEDSQGADAGLVVGQTDVALDGATVWQELYGGGEMGAVEGNTLLHFKKGKAANNAYGGGLGMLGGDENLPDNERTVLASADVKKIDRETFRDMTGNSYVVFDGEDESYTHYEFQEARHTHYDANGRVAKNAEGYYYDTEKQYDGEATGQLFSIDHNIYGGGKTAADIEGNTYVHINYGMVNDEMLTWTGYGKAADSEPVWNKVYKSIANAQFCVIGGGYGYHAEVNGNTYVTMGVEGSGKHKYLNLYKNSFYQLWDGSDESPTAISKAADAAAWSYGAPGRSCMDIIGGGFNGKVLGSTNVTLDGDIVVRKVYGGGYYASVGSTNVNVHTGIYNRIYGGGLIGNVAGKANLTIGQRGLTEDIHSDNKSLLIKDAVYGGNDVSGTVGIEAESPVNSANHGVRLNIFGGLVLGDVYGAGNGNHPGYGNPDYVEFNLSQHPSENYREVPVGAEGGSQVYKYRPRTARVEMTIQGNEGEDFNDDLDIDKVRIWGRTFGGGNSCNVGIWDGTEDDNAEKYADDDSSWHPGDNFTGGGAIKINIGSNVQLGNCYDSHDTPNGLFMGSNGEHMITQHLNKDEARYYHQYYDENTHKYWPGFKVYEADGYTPIKRSTGLKAFKAFINNILTRSDDVQLSVQNIDGTDASNVWMSNFVGGGYRGSMQALTENGHFDYTLPKGVTVSHSVVGGAFNAHIIYRVYATNYGESTYRTDADGNYLYETIEPEDGVISKAEAEERGLAEYDYIRKLYEDGHEGDPDYLTGYLRYNFDGGMLAHDSEMNATNTGSRIHQVHDPAAFATADFTSDGGYFDNKEEALVRLTLKNRLHPIVHNATESTPQNLHGGIVYGGCFLTGYVEGDTWVDYDCSLSPLCTDPRYFSKENDGIYDEAADLEKNNALNIYGAGFGKDTHSMGDVYVAVNSTGSNKADNDDHDISHQNADYPYIFNVFGGSNMGTVAGSTNVYYNSGKQGTMLGSLYGGGYKGDIGGNTYVELTQGFLINVYGGSRQADINGASRVWAYDGSTRPATGIEDFTHLIICNLYGGNDISGTISGGMPAALTQERWDALQGQTFNSHIQVSGTNPGESGFPIIGRLYAGGNGAEWTADKGAAPDIQTSLLEIDGGTTLRAFGGGNQATVTEKAYIFTDADTDNDHFADVTFTEYQKHIMQKVFFNETPLGYTWDNTRLIMDHLHAINLFGGNNIAPMSIQPTWNLNRGRLGNVYSGGNEGDMTYYNELGGTPGHEGEAKGLSISVNSDDIYIESLFGGCRMADIKALDADQQIVEFDENDYGATVNIHKGNIGNVYGGNDVSGYVYNGTNVNLSGSITGNVYGAGNGDYLYAYDADGSHTGSQEVVETLNRDLNKRVYWVKGTESASPLQQILKLNSVRPHVEKAHLNIEGESEDNKVYIQGAVYCGGNSATIRPVTGNKSNAHVRFNIGNNVIVNEVFMGSNGESLTYNTNKQDNSYLGDFERVNNINLAPTQDLTDADWDALNEEDVPLGDRELLTMDPALRQQIYPNLLSVYMRAVDMEAMPQGLNEFSGQNFTNTWIGSFCMGGNAGSMMIDSPVDVIFPKSLNFFSHIIGGSKNASFQYKGKWHRGGFRMPLAAGATLDGVPTKTKLRMKVRGDWYSRRMIMDDEYKESGTYAPAGDYLVLDRTTDGINWDRDGEAWNDGCNVYGGCYESGDMVGDVEIYIESDMLAYSRISDHDINAYVEPSLDVSNKLKLPVANVYGAGYGPESRSYGDTFIYMKDIPGNVGYTHPSVNNIFGGGRNGMLIGNSIIHVHDGLVYKDVVGGCFAAPLYGSSQVTVGYPKFYICKKSGEYILDRADKWNEGYSTKGNGCEEPVIRNRIKYFEGNYIPCNVFDLITGVNLPGSTETIDLSSMHSDTRGSNDYFSFHNEYDSSPENPENYFPENGWDDVEILVRGSVYGGGYSLSNSTSAIAGSYTTLKCTEQYNQGIDSQGNSSVGYGGNSSVIITDQGHTADHIRISTEVSSDGEYTGIGGIYGDGRLVFCEGFRAAEINGYGYVESTIENPLMLNSLQRFDLLTINDCCLKLYGDEDFGTDELNSQRFSLARIGELRMNSSIDADADLGTKRNYIAFYNQIHYLGSIVTNDDFHTGKYHDHEGHVSTMTYREKKQEYIDHYHHGTDQESINTFKQRNYATARNMVGINSGYCLRVENLYYQEGLRKTYYGPIVGVAEVKLLNVQPGEGGGYVYADNIHADIYDAEHPGDPTFMNESGNFVFQGVTRPGEDVKQFIIDDCLPTGYDEWAAGRGAASALPEQHYWYVIGDTYYYNTTLTAFTYNDIKTFNLTVTDPNVIFAGIEEGSEVQLNSVIWQPTTYPDGYTNDIRGEREGSLTPLSGTTTYNFALQVGGTSWSENMPRSMSDTQALPSPTEWKSYGALTTNPQFNVLLTDNVNNCPKEQEEEYYNNHLSVPEHVQVIIKARKQDGEINGVPTYETKTYNVMLEIVYLQGPSFSGNVKLKNCALPGEQIGFSSDGIEIRTTDQLPLMSYGWKLVPLTSETPDPETHKMTYTWDASSIKAQDIPDNYYTTALNGNVEGAIPALYSQNKWNIFFTFTAGGETFTVEPTKDEDTELSKRMLIVHNYHKMADISAHSLTESVAPGARIYLEDEADLQAFVAWINGGNPTEGINFIMQKDITLTASLPAVTQPFAGSLHGDGHHIDLGTYSASLFRNNLTGSVYNLGLIGGTIATGGTRENCYEYADTPDFTYGKMAYTLSHHFTPQAAGYVEQYYANGDYQYATTDRVWSLRTGVPNYASTDTHHDTSHAHDPARWDEETATNIPLHDGHRVVPNRDEISFDDTVVKTYLGLPANYANDYLYFGQHLDRENADPYPVHIDPIANGDADNTKGGNRVYKASGFYGNGTNSGFYYNHDAWALQPTLTAVDFTFRNPNEDSNEANIPGRYNEADDPLAGDPSQESTADINQPTAFHVDSNADHCGGSYDNAAYGHVTQNLIVVGENPTANPTQAAILSAGLYADGTPEDDIRYHRVCLAAGANNVYDIDYFHLVDKQDFNSPVSFTVNERAWYERLPQTFRNVTSGYGSATAWEGVTLPFMFTTKVSGEPQEIEGNTYENVLSHFYGEPTAEMLSKPALNDRTLHHEYWLTGLVAADGDKATFARPTGDEHSANFYVPGSMMPAYTYENFYYRNLPGYTGYYDNRTEEGYDENGSLGGSYSWYGTKHNFLDYPFQFHGVPYICAFPGDDFYEFSLEGQKVTFEVGHTVIAKSDVDINDLGTTTAGTLRHVGTYQHITADASHLGINTQGSAFEDNYDILPFRTYMTTTAGAHTPRFISILSQKDKVLSPEDDAPATPEDELLPAEDEGPRYDLQGRRISNHHLRGIIVGEGKKVIK